MKLWMCFVILMLPCVSVGSTAYINQIPDFTQTDVIGESSGNGWQYCGPAAVSNSIIWLAGKSNQQQLVHKLASKQYMNTSLKNGTGTTGVLRGVDKISRELFGGYKSLTYEGWRKHPAAYSSGKRKPDINKIKSAISKSAAAWINVGWYKHDQQENTYRRIGGHWLTLVGSTADQLIFHDPSPRAGEGFANEYVSYSILTSGSLTGKKHGLPVSAKGYISLGRGMHIKRKADIALMDGVVYLEK